MAKKFELSDAKVKEGMKDYILLTLGAPVVKVELDEGQLDLCVNRVCEMMGNSSRVASWSDVFKLAVAQDGALAHAKMILGRVRAKYGFKDVKEVKTKSKSKTDSTLPFSPLDGGQLLEEGERQYRLWYTRVFGKIKDEF